MTEERRQNELNVIQIMLDGIDRRRVSLARLRDQLSRGAIDPVTADIVRGAFETICFEVATHLKSGALVPVAEATPPLPVQLAFLYPHKRLQDPKVRLFMEFAANRIAAQLPR